VSSSHTHHSTAAIVCNEQGDYIGVKDIPVHVKTALCALPHSDVLKDGRLFAYLGEHEEVWVALWHLSKHYESVKPLLKCEGHSHLELVAELAADRANLDKYISAYQYMMSNSYPLDEDIKQKSAKSLYQALLQAFNDFKEIDSS